MKKRDTNFRVFMIYLKKEGFACPYTRHRRGGFPKMKKVVVIVLSILLALSIAGNALLYVKYDNEKDQSAQNRASSATL